MILTILGDWVSVVQSVVIDKADVVRLFEARSLLATGQSCTCSVVLVSILVTRGHMLHVM